MKRGMCVVLLLLIVTSSFVWAVGSKETQTDVPTVLIMPKLIGIPYFNASEKGALQAGKDLGIKVIYNGPTECDAAAQVKMIEDYISQGVDAIAIAPNDAAALTPVLRKAKSLGIKILDWDTPADKAVVDISVHQIDDVEYGRHIFDLLVKHMGTDDVDYAILTGGLEAANLNAWIDYGIEYAKTKYPRLRLVTERIPTNEKQEEAYNKALNLLKAYPTVKGIVAMSSPAPIGAGQAIEELGLVGKVAVTGTGLPTDSCPYLTSGAVSEVTLWNPATLGYLAVYLANELIQGRPIVNGMDVPNVGKISLKEDGKTVIMGPPADYNKSNCKQFDF
jgi:simple sugar transport system substrate-binding protein